MLYPRLFESCPRLADGDLPVVHGDFAQELPLLDVHASLHGSGDYLAGDFGGDFNSALGFRPAPQHHCAGARFGRRHGDADFAQLCAWGVTPLGNSAGVDGWLSSLGIADKRARPYPQDQHNGNDGSGNEVFGHA